MRGKNKQKNMALHRHSARNTTSNKKTLSVRIVVQLLNIKQNSIDAIIQFEKFNK